MLFSGQDKITALEEVNVLNSKKVTNSKAREIIRDLLAVIAKGTNFNNTEATNVFFTVTKLFQFSNPLIIRFCHLIIYEMTHFTNDTLIATSSLIKNINSNNNFYKSSAIKVLMAITDDNMIGSIERYIKQALVFNDPRVASTAVVSAYKRTNFDIPRRWLNEISQALDSKDQMLQYHAFALLFQLKKEDKLAMLKMFTKYQRIINSPLGISFLIKTAIYQIKTENLTPGATINSNSNVYFDFLGQCLHSRNDIVLSEICRNIVYLDKLTPKICLQLISAVKIQLNNPKSCVRLSTIRSLYELVNRHEYLIAEMTKSNISDQLEFLINDSNRNVIMFAVVITLKLATGKNISKALNLTMQFMSELPDELKIKIIYQLKFLILKYPNHNEILSFLNKILKESGSHDFKLALVDVLLILVKKFEKQRDHALMILCDYTEDCEYTSLLVKAMYYIGKYACYTSNPLRFVRPIYNRLVLENQSVRIAAIHTLARISNTSNDARKQILHIISRFIDDTDGQVKSIAIFYHNLLLNSDPNLSISEAYLSFILKTKNSFKNVTNPLLEDTLKSYLANSDYNKQFDFDQIEMILKTESIAKKISQSKEQRTAHMVDIFDSTSDSKDIKNNDKSFVPGDSRLNTNDNEINNSDEKSSKNLNFETLMNDLNKFKQFDLGCPILISSKPSSLSESDSEYIVTCYKYFFSDSRLLFQFVVKNTIQDIKLRNVSVSIESTVHTQIIHTVPCSEIDSNSEGYTYSLVSFTTEEQNESSFINTFLNSELQCTLTFEVSDKVTQSVFPDEYQLEMLDFNLADLVVESKPTVNFETEWNSLPKENELQMKFSFSCFKNIENAISEIVSSLGMRLLDQSTTINQNSNNQQSMCKVLGLFMNKYTVAAAFNIVFHPKQLMTVLDIKVRSPEYYISELILSPFSD